MKKVFLFLIFLLGISFSKAYAQSTLNPFVVEDDTLPIANSRFDDAIEVPEDNFSSAEKNDTWEKFERGELGAKAYADLQKDYNSKTKNKTAKNKSTSKTKRDVAAVPKNHKKDKKNLKSKVKRSQNPRKPQSVPSKLPPKKTPAKK